MTRLAPLIDCPKAKRDDGNDHAKDDGSCMVHDRTDVVMTLIGQVAGGREHFYNTDHTEEEKHHPDDLVSFEYITNLFVHIL